MVEHYVDIVGVGGSNPPAPTKPLRAAFRIQVGETVMAGDAAAPVGPYPHARRVGDLLFLSGIGPRRPGDPARKGSDGQRKAMSSDGSKARSEPLMKGAVGSVTVPIPSAAGNPLEHSGAGWHNLGCRWPGARTWSVSSSLG